MRVLADGAWAERVLATELDRSDLDARDRALVAQLVYGTLREGPRLEAALRARLAQPESRLPTPVRAALRMGAYQLLATRIPAHSAVDEAVGLVRRFGRLTGLVNAVLRGLARAGASDVEVACDQGADTPPEGMPAGLWGMLLERRSPGAARAWWAACGQAPAVCLRVNQRATSTALQLARLEGAGIRATRPHHRPGGAADPCLMVHRAGRTRDLPGWGEGALTVQDPAAVWVGQLLAEPAGRRPVLLDMCAAPGGKLLHLLEAWGHAARALACDIHPGRLGLVTAAARRLGLAPPATCALDARDPAALLAALAAAGLPRPTHVLLDAPCSALGTLRRHPERLARHDLWRPEALEKLATQQRDLLAAAAAVLAPGGTLLYAVCTFTAAEGPKQVEAFLARHPRFVRRPPPPSLDFAREGEALCTWTDLHGADSFFAQALVDRGAAPTQSLPP